MEWMERAIFAKNVTGFISPENSRNFPLVVAEENLVTVAKDDIEERNRGPSATRGDLTKYLSKSDLRDLGECPATLGEPGKRGKK
jgi:hypothetical protein